MFKLGNRCEEACSLVQVATGNIVHQPLNEGKLSHAVTKFLRKTDRKGDQPQFEHQVLPKPRDPKTFDSEECFTRDNKDRSPNHCSRQQPPLDSPNPQHSKALKLSLNRGNGLPVVNTPDASDLCYRCGKHTDCE